MYYDLLKRPGSNPGPWVPKRSAMTTALHARSLCYTHTLSLFRADRHATFGRTQRGRDFPSPFRVPSESLPSPFRVPPGPRHQPRAAAELKCDESDKLQAELVRDLDPLGSVTSLRVTSLSITSLSATSLSVTSRSARPSGRVSRARVTSRVTSLGQGVVSPPW